MWFGIKFDSQIEGHRYLQLREMFERGEISELECHPKFKLQPSFKDHDGKTVRAITYTADFQYVRASDGVTVVEDVKPSRKGKPAIPPDGWLRIKIFQYQNRHIEFNVVAM